MANGAASYPAPPRDSRVAGLVDSAVPAAFFDEELPEDDYPPDDPYFGR